MALYNLEKGENFIKYYEGIEAIKSIYENLLKSTNPKKERLVIADSQKWMALDPDYFKNFVKRRAKLNLNIRLLLQDSELARKYKKFEKNYSHAVKILLQIAS